MNLVKTIVFQSRPRAQEPAIAHAGGIVSYGALMRATEAAVEALAIFDLPAGSLVMLDIRHPVHHTAMIFALALLGLPSASVGGTFAVEKAGVLPRLFLTDRDDLQLAGVHVIRIDERWFVGDPKRPVDYAGMLRLPGFPSPTSVVRYVYSSGTTGYPKCVALTQECLDLRMAQAVGSFGWSVQGPASLNMMGFSTIAGIMAPILVHLRGALLCYAANNDEAQQMMRVFRVASVSFAVGQLQSFMDSYADGQPLTSVQLLTVSGAKLTPRLLAEARARICSHIWVGYGSTEMGSISAGPAGLVDHHEGGAGYILPHVTVEAVDGDGVPVAAGEEGVLRVRTPHAAFYVDADGKPVDMFEDGWFYPGDIGRIHADALLTITGRANEVINRGGVIVAPEVIEEVLRHHARLVDVAALAVPGRSGGDEVWAAVVSGEPLDTTALIAAVRPRLNEKTPDRIIQVAAIPRNANQKVQRNLLRDLLIETVG